MKLALIVGNADYEDYKQGDNYSDLAKCSHRKCHEKFEKYSSMRGIYQSMSSMKNELSNLGFLVISFVNVNVNDYMKALSLLKKLCKPACRAYVLVYVAGHGHNCKNLDYLVPVDARMYFHMNDHKPEYFLANSKGSSLVQLMQTFSEINNEKKQEVSSSETADLVADVEHANCDKLTVRVLWDLCRSIDNDLDDMMTNDPEGYMCLFGISYSSKYKFVHQKS